MSDELITTMLTFLKTISSTDPLLTLLCSSDLFHASNIIYLPIGTSTLIFFYGIGFKTIAKEKNFMAKDFLREALG